MPRRRHTMNPAKVKRDAQALEEAPPRLGPRPMRLGRRSAVALLGALTIVLLTASFAPFDVWPLAYVALVPWTLALRVAPTRRWALLAAWLSGLVFWGVSLHWLMWITMVGYLAGILYLSVYWLAAGAMLHAGLRRGWPMWIFLPVVWVALEFLRALCPPEFPWFFLAQTQYGRTALIQIADITGQYGVSFFVAMVNGLAVDAAVALLAARGQAPAEAAVPASFRARLVRGAVVTAGVLAALLAYGTWQLSRHTQTPGPVIGIVQRAIPITLEGRNASPEEILESHLAGTAEFAGQKVDLVIWPETMLPSGLNGEFLRAEPGKLSDENLRALAYKFYGPRASAESVEWDRDQLYGILNGGRDVKGKDVPGHRQLAAKVLHMAARVGAPILAGGATLHPNDRPLYPLDAWVARNGAIWFDPNGKEGPVYAKRQLVPFSEYVPFKRSWPAFHMLLRQCVPEMMSQLDQGPAWTRFPLARPDGSWRVVSPICYEGTFPDVCRNMVYQDGQKKADIIANLSNDGWFVWRWGQDGPWHGTTEQAQHLSHYCFRAVENRVPVVRAVNTGISASIDSNGRLVAEVSQHSDRTMVSGSLVLDGATGNYVEYLAGHGPKVLVDTRVSWYSHLGDSFAGIVALICAGTLVWLAKKRPEKKEGVQT